MKSIHSAEFTDGDTLYWIKTMWRHHGVRVEHGAPVEAHKHAKAMLRLEASQGIITNIKRNVNYKLIDYLTK